MVTLVSAKGKEEFYEKFGFIKRPNEDFGCEMGFIDINEDWYEDKENEDPLYFTACYEDVECYERVWGEGALEGTGYENCD